MTRIYYPDPLERKILGMSCIKSPRKSLFDIDPEGMIVAALAEKVREDVDRVIREWWERDLLFEWLMLQYGVHYTLRLTAHVV